MRQIIIARNGVIPGKRTFRVELFRRFNLTVDTKRIASIMKEMNLVAQMPHKDAYKHHASHNHVCAAPENKVNQNFYLSLVQAAYHTMMDVHKEELGEVMKKDEVYLHSDQGSQYLATSFGQLLKEDGFVQSVSARGNSWDNAPMESFFGRLKTSILDMVAMCKDFDCAKQLVDGYLRAYNEEHYQYDLAGLTPTEFYQYATTGVYPLDHYFGVPASAMMTGGDLKNVRRKYADDEAAKCRAQSTKKREERRLIHPEKIIQRDQKLLQSVIAKWSHTKTTAEIQIAKMNSILELASKSDDIYTNIERRYTERIEGSSCLETI